MLLKPVFLLGWVLVIFSFPAGAFGAPVADLFDSIQTVPDYSPEARERAVLNGLREVLVRYSGSEDVLNEVGVVSMLQNPKVYVSSFSYRTRTDQNITTEVQADLSADDLSGDFPRGSVDSEPEYDILIEFNGQQIHNQLVQAGLPVWSSNRPRVILWWVVDQGGERQVLSRSSNSPTLAAVRTLQRLRGLDIVLPHMDEKDQQSVTAHHVWALDYERLEVASRRYRPSAILVVRASSSYSGTWYTQWGVLFDGRLHTFDGEFSDSRSMARNIINPLAERLARHYAIVVRLEAADAAEIQLRVYDVRELQDYARISEYLEQLIVVKRLGLLQVEPGQLVFGLQLQGSLAQFKQALNLDYLLAPYQPQPDEDAPGIKERFADTLDLGAGQPAEVENPLDTVNRVSLSYRWTPAPSL